MKNRTRWPFVVLAFLFLFLFAASGCRSTSMATPEHADYVDEMPTLSPVSLGEGEKLQVVATTSIVADLVKNVGGDLIDLTLLVPLGTDPHTFEPTPQDAAAVADAHVVFVNGAGLEVFLEPLLESAGGSEAKVVPVSYGIELKSGGGEHEGTGTPEAGRQHESGGFDPHTWFDPNNVMVWTRNTEHALSALDPDNSEVYAANAGAYEAKLQELDAWIREQVAQVPEANRRLVTDHTTFTYFVHRYGFEQISAVFPGYSTVAEPSAQDLAALQDAIREFGVKAVFVGLTVNPGLAQHVAQDTGIRLVFLYTGSLSEPGGPADDYLALMQYNVSAIVDALK